MSEIAEMQLYPIRPNGTLIAKNNLQPFCVCQLYVSLLTSKRAFNISNTTLQLYLEHLLVVPDVTKRRYYMQTAYVNSLTMSTSPIYLSTMSMFFICNCFQLFSLISNSSTVPMPYCILS